MTWIDCLESGKVKRTSPNKQLVISTIKMSQIKIDNERILEEHNGDPSIRLTLAYDSFLEICTGILSLEGMKSYSHECITCFLSDYLNEKKISIIFDDARNLRNRINYYGEEVPENTVNRDIERIYDSITYLKTKYLKDFEI